MNPIAVTIPMRAMPKPRDGRYSWRNGVHSKAKYHAWRDEFRLRVGGKFPVVYGGPVALYVGFCIKGRPAKKPRQFQNRGDADNLVGAVMDVLNGIAYQDDRQVMRLEVEIYERQADDLISVRVSPR